MIYSKKNACVLGTNQLAVGQDQVPFTNLDHFPGFH